MELRSFEIDGPLELIPRKIEDARGYFSEVFRLDVFSERAGLVQFVQDNQSLSVHPGTIRGMHFQTHPAAQGKLVRCVAGELLDVIVDLRTDSSTYGRYVSVILSPESNNQLWVPVGFAHGFCTLVPNTIISYRVSNYYSQEHDRGLAWNDPDVGIDWPDIADHATLSDKDRRQPALAALPRHFTMENSRCA